MKTWQIQKDSSLVLIRALLSVGHNERQLKQISCASLKHVLRKRSIKKECLNNVRGWAGSSVCSDNGGEIRRLKV